MSVGDRVTVEGVAAEWHHSSYLSLRPILIILLERVKRPGSISLLISEGVPVKAFQSAYKTNPGSLPGINFICSKHDTIIRLHVHVHTYMRKLSHPDQQVSSGCPQ